MNKKETSFPFGQAQGLSLRHFVPKKNAGKVVNATLAESFQII
jgi:hypothetical protein